MARQPDRGSLNNYDQVRSLLGELCATDDPNPSPEARGELESWRSLWSTVAVGLLRQLEASNVVEFEAGFRIVSAALGVCEPVGRQAAAAALFGDFTRRAIASGLDRTRFVEWFGPAELFKASAGRVRGRVLYFNDGKGCGKALGADGIVYFVHFAMIRGTGVRSLGAGQLIEFTPRFQVINDREDWAALDVARLAEADGTEFNAEVG